MSQELDFWNRPRSWKAITLALSIFAGINAVLYFSPELFAGEKLEQSNRLEANLASQAAVLDQLKASLAARRKTMEVEKAALKTFATQDGANYDRRVEQYNVAVDTFNEDLQRYRTLIIEYKNSVEEFSTLIKAIPSRALIFPGLPSRKAHSAKVDLIRFGG
jgi:hypothetical protein